MGHMRDPSHFDAHTLGYNPLVSLEDDLESVAQTVEQRGTDAQGLHELSVELARLHKPTAEGQRWHRRALEAARTQFVHALGEMGESARAAQIIVRAIRDRASVSAHEREEVKAQLLDIFRVVPASALATANAALPIPGTSLATPWLLIKLGLMPSRWRESYILNRLQKESDRLKALGLDAQAARVAQISDEVERGIESRDVCAGGANLLRFWDANGDNAWDDDERAAYGAALTVVVDAVLSQGHRKQWFALQGASVVGPFILSEGGNPRDLHGLPDDGLLCFKGTSGWVCIDDLRRLLHERLSAQRTSLQ